MPPNWNKFKTIVHKMIETDLGAMECEISTPTGLSYDFITGEIEGDPIITTLKAGLMPVNKDDLKELPEGLREKITRKSFTTIPIAKNAKITSLFDNTQFQVIIPSVPLTAGGMVHCYKTFMGKIENTLGE